MEQVLACLKKNEVINLGVLDTKRKELVYIGNAILVGDKRSIAKHVEKALDAGASREEILKVVAFIIGDGRLLSSIVELLRVLRYEENKRAPHISWVDDCREE